MNFSATTLKAKAQTLLLHRSESAMASPAIARPVRDWKITLLAFSLLVLVFGAFSVASYVGLLGKRALDEKQVPSHASKLDRAELTHTLLLLEERARLHESARGGSRVFVDPGR